MELGQEYRAYCMQGKTIRSQSDHVIACLEKFFREYGQCRVEILLNPALSAVANTLSRTLAQSIAIIRLSERVKPPLTFYIRRIGEIE